MRGLATRSFMLTGRIKTKTRTAPERRPSCIPIPLTRRHYYDKSRKADCGVAFACANIAVPA
jgi:hypothetical protein